LYYTVYKVTNKLDGKFYIGKHQTKDLNDGYMGSGIRICAAIKKYGVENFKKEILHLFETEAEMNEAESRLVVLCENSYNLCPGGKGGWGYVNINNLGGTAGTSPTKETRYKISESLREVMLQPERRFRLSSWCVENGNGMEGKKHSEDTIKKMSGPRGKYNVQKTGIKRGPYKKKVVV